MNRKLCSQIFHWLVDNHGFYRSYLGDGEKFHLWKSVVNSLGCIVNLNIRFETDDSEKVFLLYLTDSYNGNYFRFTSLQEFQSWYKCLDVAQDVDSTKVKKKDDGKEKYRRGKGNKPVQAYGGTFNNEDAAVKILKKFGTP